MQLINSTHNVQHTACTCNLRLPNASTVHMASNAVVNIKHAHALYSCIHIRINKNKCLHYSKCLRHWHVHGNVLGNVHGNVHGNVSLHRYWLTKSNENIHTVAWIASIQCKLTTLLTLPHPQDSALGTGTYVCSYLGHLCLEGEQVYIPEYIYLEKNINVNMYQIWARSLCGLIQYVVVGIKVTPRLVQQVCCVCWLISTNTIHKIFIIFSKLGAALFVILVIGICNNDSIVEGIRRLHYHRVSSCLHFSYSKSLCKCPTSAQL